MWSALAFCYSAHRASCIEGAAHGDPPRLEQAALPGPDVQIRLSASLPSFNAAERYSLQLMLRQHRVDLEAKSATLFGPQHYRPAIHQTCDGR